LIRISKLKLKVIHGDYERHALSLDSRISSWCAANACERGQMSGIIERIERETKVPGLASLLAEKLDPTDLQSLLLEVYRLRAGQRSPAAVLADYARNRFVKPSPVLPRRLLEWERAALAELPPVFEPLILSPVCPLGTASVVASVTQNWSVATSRNTEVVSDSSNVLALECALRRRDLLKRQSKSTDAVHLASSHRLLRAQRFESPHSYSHFSTFVLCTAGRDCGDMAFELAALALHIDFYVRALRRFLKPDLRLRLAVSDFSPQVTCATLESQLLAPIRARFENIECVLDSERQAGRGYYDDVCFKIYAQNREGQMLELGDGGSVSWTRKLLSNSKERMVSSGIGSERVCTAFEY
jgi:hypothetical protein